MPTIAETLATAIEHHRAGRLQVAEQIYRQILAVEPNQPDAWHLLGLIAYQVGKHAMAIEYMAYAIRLKPGVAAYHSNLGLAHRALGKLEEAAACWRRAVDLEPDSAEAHNNLGNVLLEQGKPGEAVAWLRLAVQRKPDHAQAQKALGIALRELGKLDEAVACLQRLLQQWPDYAEAHNSLGNTLRKQEKLEPAAACYRRAIELKPDFAEAHNNLGLTSKDLGELETAVACCRRAIELLPGYADAHNNLGNALTYQGKPEEAVACYEQALQCKADHADAHFNRSLVWLQQGDFDRGWPEYEWRRRMMEFRPPPFPQPLWDGRPALGQTILLYAEQGFGDTLQFVRYASLVKRPGVKVVVQCPRALLRLLAICPGVDEAIGSGEDLPAFDFHAPLLSLPGIFHTSLETIPAVVPYLFADLGLVERWRAELAPVAGFKIGIFWRGTTTDPARIIPPGCFESLAGLPGVRLMSLQKGPGAAQLQDRAGRFPIVEVGSRLDDFMDTAAVLRNLDLLIACDTAVAHLAGALGVPVWVALPFAADWRWLLHRSDSPWYPTMRLFRQQRPGDWAGVFEAIRAALASR